jgi:heat-inducible transcriptional repressor
MPELTARQRTILMLLIRDHIETAQPVGSKRLVERFHLDLSPATVRNEMSALTEMGYLRQPHTSAGRVPAEEGYRVFVGQMMSRAELPVSVQNAISHQFFQARADVEQWMTLAASVLAHQSQSVSLVTAPHAETIRFKHIELISTQGRQVLMVLVMEGGEVDQQVLTLAEPVTQDRLSQVAVRLNSLLAGLSVDAIATLSSRSEALEQDIITLLAQDMKRTSESTSGEIYTDGLTNVLSEPEFAESSDESRWAMRLFEERSTLQDLLARASTNSSVGGLQVLIGGVGGWQELRQCSMVIARYGAPGLATGTLGVLGPMRMSYARTIPTVRYVAGLLSNLVNNSISNE